LRSRRDRLILERNVAEPGARRGGAQTREGDVVAGGVDLAGAADDEMHWPPDEHAAAAAIELRRRRLAQRGEDDSDQILEGELPAEHVGAIEQPAGDKGLER